MKQVMHVVTSRDFLKSLGKKKKGTQQYSNFLTWISASGRAGMNIRLALPWEV